MVVDSNNNSIAPTGLNSRARHLSIHKETKSFNTIGRDGGIGDVEGVCYDFASYWRIGIVIRIDIKAAELVVTGLALAWNAVG